MKVRPGAVIRGAGVALACLTSDTSTRSPILLAAYTGGWFLDKPGLQVFVVIPETDEPWRRATVPFATSAASWSLVMLAATAILRRTRLPVMTAAVALGGAVTLVDSLLADREEARATATATAVEADAEAESAGQRP